MSDNYLFVFAVVVNFALLANCDPHCGYQACPKVDPDVLTVHLVPHTHDDVGWVKTVDEYFNGEQMGNFGTGVKSIIESVISELVLDPTRKFIWVETAYFWKWWQHKNESMRDVVRKLVAEGQLEITGGGWTMNDEAVTHYQSTVDQFTWGFRRLSVIFGTCGRSHVGWQIDPFGHSRETASLMAQLGFDGLFFGRLDEDDKSKRLRTKTAEFIWRGSPNLGKESDLFTGVLYNQYSPPRGFCFDTWCADYISDNKTNLRYNADEKVADFVYKAKEQAQHYRTNNIMWTMGMDFHYMVASKWYNNMDTLIKHVNEISKDTGVRAVYSTPSCYLQALHKANLTWSTKEDDFFPYASEPHSYWTGFFTSRPNLKRFERQGNNFLQACKQLHVTSGSGETANLNALREAMGVLQHHDAITGTEKQYVANDYIRILSEGISRCEVEIDKAIGTLSGNKGAQFKRCPLLNISQCEVSENSDMFTVTLYNPLGRKVDKFVRLPVYGQSYEVTDLTTGEKLETQLLPLHGNVLQIPGRMSQADKELVFLVKDIPALGFKSIDVKTILKVGLNFKLKSVPKATEISNEFVTIKLDKMTGFLGSVIVDGKETALSQEYFYYKSGKRGHIEEDYNPPLRASGAYIFRPNSSTPERVVTGKKHYYEIYTGPLVQIIHMTFSPWASQVIRLYKGQKHFEMEWLIGPIPTEDGVGKEVISWFSMDRSTSSTFMTDANGREFLSRRIDFRPTWNAKILEPVSGNYYPVTTAITTQTEDTKMAVLVDRAQAGGSVFDNTLELMVHRRLVQDDGYGVQDVLDETYADKGLVTRGRHIVLIGPAQGDFNAQMRDLIQREMVLEPLLFFSDSPQQVKQGGPKNTDYSALTTDLPSNVHLLTLEPWGNGTVLLRLEHSMEKIDDAANLSKPATVTLQGLFKTMKIKKAMEMSLGANQKLEEVHRFQWQEEQKKFKKGDTARTPPPKKPIEAPDFAVKLYPMQIRTFVLDVEFL